jgi:hypothetical protein
MSSAHRPSVPTERRSAINLVVELQKVAVESEVLTVLRMTKVVASKLNRKDISDWLKWEQEGYADPESVPPYRRLNFNYAFNTNGLIPGGFGTLMTGTQDLQSYSEMDPIPLGTPIATVLKWIDGGAQNICQPIAFGCDLDNFLRRVYRFDSLYANQISFVMHLNGSQIRAIPDQIIDRVLDWACSLSEAGVTGEGMSFSTEEKAIAHSIVFNIHGSTIGQLSNSGTNSRTGK